jgi:hypothetical protein
MLRGVLCLEASSRPRLGGLQRGGGGVSHASPADEARGARVATNAARAERVVGDADAVVARSCWRGNQRRTIATGNTKAAEQGPMVLVIQLGFFFSGFYLLPAVSGQGQDA